MPQNENQPPARRTLCTAGSSEKQNEILIYDGYFFYL